MRERIFLLALSSLLFALSAPVEAQRATKTPKIGVLRAASGPESSPELYLRAFRELGYVEGKNIAFEFRYSEGKLERLPVLVDELVRLKVDVLVASSTSAALAAKNAAKTIPIVFLNVSDPVASGLIDSLPRPGGNITGIASIDSVLAGKRLELLKETIPNLSRVAVLWNAQDRGSTQQWNESQLSARELGLQVHSMEISSADKLEGAFKEASKTLSTALSVTQHPLAASNRKRIVDLAIKNKLPAIYSRGDYVAIGGLMSYGVDQAEPSRRVASMVDKILKGAKPADLPVEQPTKFELLINFKTANALGLAIPPVVMMRAEKVIK
jgi:putative ABC transport system substrate-binding protein